jgi:flagellar biosynthesis protein FlhF
MMRIKSYFAKTLDEAMAAARAELGDEALLLSTRKSDSQEPAGQAYEVAFGWFDEAGRNSSDSAVNEAAPAAAKGLSPELESVRAQLRELQALLGAEQRAEAESELDDVRRNLIAAGLDPVLVGEITGNVESGLKTEPGSRQKRPFVVMPGSRRQKPEMENLLRAELSARIPIDSSLGVDGAGAVVALVGPGGSGKTTTLMKIAAFEAGPERPVRLFTLDPDLSSRMKMQFFARKAGIRFEAVEQLEALPERIAEARENEIVLIDTPGCAAPADADRIAAVLGAIPSIDIHLVIPSYMSAQAARAAIGRYAKFRPAKLLISKIDEYPAIGTAVSEAVRAGLALSLVTSGTAIPADLHALSIEEFMSAALGFGRSAEACA